MIKVSHESPVSMLKESLKYNDYQYCLVHLMEQNEQYHDWFMEKYRANDPEGEILLDNSIFELGHSFDPQKYAEWANKIKPNFYIVPDVLEESEATMTSWDKFVADTGDDLPGLKIGAVQGKTWTDIVECYKFMSDKADYIALSFDFSYYQVTGYGKDKLQRWCNGRPALIERLVKEGIWNWSKPHHLLGASLAREFAAYPGKYNIRSVDTSNPVVAGLLGHRYNGDNGLTHKPSTLLADLINARVDSDQKEDIMYNTKMFKMIMKRYV